MDFYGEALNRQEVYKRKYARHPRTAAFKMAVYSLVSLATKDNEQQIDVNESSNSRGNVNGLSQSAAVSIYENLDPKKINIAISVEGGIGDIVVALNYVYAFAQKYSDNSSRLDIFCFRNYEITKMLFGNDIATNIICCNHDDFFKKKYHGKYDIYICLSRYPRVFHKNAEKLFARNEKLLDYILMLEKFRLTHPRFLDHGPIYDGQQAIFESIRGRKRIQQPDVDGSLGLSEKFLFDFSDRCDFTVINELSRYAMGKRIVVLVNAVDSKYGTVNSTKSWMRSYWDIMVEKVKNERPDLFLVQIGAGDTEQCIKGVHLSLVNRTSFSETMGILGRADLLISNEGGMVHVRHALNGGKSIVIFGSTEEKFFGYSENVNIRGKGCMLSCEWNANNWQKRCINKMGGTKACTLSLLPEEVLEQINANI